MVKTVDGDKVKWFNPWPWKWTDPNGTVWFDRVSKFNNLGRSASGLSIEVPGIALPTKYTLKGWWKFNLDDWQLYGQQTDVNSGDGVLEINAALAWRLFKTPDNVKSTPWSAVFLGHDFSEVDKYMTKETFKYGRIDTRNATEALATC